MCPRQSIPKSPLNREDPPDVSHLQPHQLGNASKHLNAGIILLSKTTVRNSTKNTNEAIGEDKENEGSAAQLTASVCSLLLRGQEVSSNPGLALNTANASTVHHICEPCLRSIWNLPEVSLKYLSSAPDLYPVAGVFLPQSLLFQSFPP